MFKLWIWTTIEHPNFQKILVKWPSDKGKQDRPLSTKYHKPLTSTKLKNHLLSIICVFVRSCKCIWIGERGEENASHLPPFTCALKGDIPHENYMSDVLVQFQTNIASSLLPASFTNWNSPLLISVAIWKATTNDDTLLSIDNMFSMAFLAKRTTFRTRSWQRFWHSVLNMSYLQEQGTCNICLDKTYNSINSHTLHFTDV